MPELPEVESVVRALSPEVAGSRVVSFVIHTHDLRKMVDGKTLAGFVQGQVIESVRRRAKWPGLVFSSGVLWLHLGMTGQIRLLPQGTFAGEHDHLDLLLDNGSMLRFHDPRRFGMIAWTQGKDSEPPSRTLGVEPFDANFTDSFFHEGLQRSKKAIKPFLMDGKLVAGVGNIYASEALFAAKIHPDTAACSISKLRAKELRDAIVDILGKAVAAGGSTLRDYRKPDGSQGAAQLLHKVYGRAAKPCFTCGTSILMSTHAGRATFWCPVCQKS